MSDNTRGTNWHAAGICLVLVTIVLIFLFLWPGPLRYEYRDYAYPGASGARTLIKIDRMTHGVWLLNNGKWQRQ